MHPTITLFNVPIDLYPVFLGVGWAVAYIVIKESLQKNNWVIDRLELLLSKLFLTSWAGAKLAFFVTKDSVAWSDLLTVSFWLGGGLVFYGGFLAGLAYLVVNLYRSKAQVYAYVSFIPALAIGHGLGRIGCFFAGCCYGSHCDLPWKIMLHGQYRHPVQLYEALLLLGFGIWSLLRVWRGKVSQLPLYYIMYYALVRFGLEFFRADTYRGIYYGVSFSQWIALVLGMASGLAVIMIRKKKINLE
jgi:phosphatidylglycerol:prolipoprotein diacylglycerol transferase